MADLFPEEGSPARLKDSFREALSRATDSWMDHHNAKLRAARFNDRREFMEDVGKGWIVDQSWTPDKGREQWRERSKGLDPPDWEKNKAFTDQYETDEWAAERLDEPGYAGRFMGKGSLGTPVYIDQGDMYTSSLSSKGSGFTGVLGAFAPEGRYVRSAPATGTLGHELGHAKQAVMEDPYVLARRRVPGRKYFYEKEHFGSARDSARAASEAVAGYLGRRIVRSKKGWGAAADDKSWAAYKGLPSYLRELDEPQLAKFLQLVDEYGEQYPGIADEVERVIENYDTLVSPKIINDTSRGDWSEEGLKFMKEWRKKKGLKEVPTGNLKDRARQMGPYSMRQGLRGDDVGRAVAGLGWDGGGVASPEMMSKMVAAS